MTESRDRLSTSLTDSLLAEFNIEADKVVAISGTRPASHRDWSATEHLIHEAREAMRISDYRVSELEDQLAQVIAEAREAVSKAVRRAEAAERQLAASETRAIEAETWLHRIHDHLVRSFGSLNREATVRTARVREAG